MHCRVHSALYSALCIALPCISAMQYRLHCAVRSALHCTATGWNQMMHKPALISLQRSHHWKLPGESRILHYIQNYTVKAEYCTIYTNLYSESSILHYINYTIQWKQNTALYTLHFTVKAEYCIIYTTLYSESRILHYIHYTIQSKQNTALYTLHYTVKA